MVGQNLALGVDAVLSAEQVALLAATACARLRLRHISIRRQGAAVYVAPHLGRARFHLPAEEAEGHEHARRLERAGPYQVAAYLTSPAAVDEALELAKKALEATAP